MKRWIVDPNGPARALNGKNVDAALEIVRGRKWVLIRVVAAIWGVVLAMAFTAIVVVRYALSV